MLHVQSSRECDVSHYRHGCDPPKPAAPLLDCDPVPSSESCISYPQFSPSAVTRWLPICVLILSVACSTPPTYERVFPTQHEIKGNSDSIPTPLDVTWGASSKSWTNAGGSSNRPIPRGESV